MDKSITQPLTTNESSAATYNPNQNQCSILAQRPSYPMLLSPSPITPFNSYSVKKLDRADPQLSIATLQHGSNAVQVQPTTTATLNKADAPTIDSAEYQKTPAQFEAAQQVGSKPAKKIIAQLNEEELWKSFNEVGNEMIVTKPGRRLFPALVVSVKGLNSSTKYNVFLKMASTDQYRYKFFNMQWTKAGESEVSQDESKQLYLHPDSPNSGGFWMKKPISFRAIKITHNPNCKTAHILVHTMHKYVIQLVLSPLDSSGDHVISLPDTTFVAVTAYQNTNLTQMKIDNNPFAKGFRERGTYPQMQSPLVYKPLPYKPPQPFQQQFQPLQPYQPLQQVQPAQQLQAMQPILSLPPPSGQLQCSLFTPTMPTSTQAVPPPPPQATNPCSLPSQLAPYYPNTSQAYRFFTPSQNVGVLNMPRIEDYPDASKQSN